ncbi:hypothetical protein CMV_015229 [Castanea mollissima]|uniref:Uncharacterized protein n=1 Tax=Castanea mollissima TaxID=60419 RepID=A0A8J4VTL3_9ROSI|nr:hypothetical protein CMV_015229 [Castanea mollissima]
MAAEQLFNAKLLEEEMGVCVEVARGKSCEVRHEDIAAKIELVMNETQQKGKEIRRQAFEAREMIRNSTKDDFFSAALSMRTQALNLTLKLKSQGSSLILSLSLTKNDFLLKVSRNSKSLVLSLG